MLNCCFLWQHMDGSYCVKPLKQKQVVNTPAFLLSSLPSFFCVTFLMLLKDKDTPRLYYIWPMRPAPALFFNMFLSSGGWSELSTAGDLWDREQIQQPRIKGKDQTGEVLLSAPL